MFASGDFQTFSRKETGKWLGGPWLSKNYENPPIGFITESWFSGAMDFIRGTVLGCSAQAIRPHFPPPVSEASDSFRAHFLKRFNVRNLKYLSKSRFRGTNSAPLSHLFPSAFLLLWSVWPLFLRRFVFALLQIRASNCNFLSARICVSFFFFPVICSFSSVD